VLLLVGIASSKFAARLGMPVLVLFLGVGMLAGSEGVLGIAFEDYAFANNITSVALALILFDGGLRTSMESVRAAWKPALSLATLGVVLTSLLTGLAASWILDMPLTHGLLLGSIVGSTDAAAVFSILRTSGQKLDDRLAATLEVESGSNDPMAIFLTVALVELIIGNAATIPQFIEFLFLQFGVGALSGVAVGYIGASMTNRINLDYPGLYPLIVLAFGLLSFGVAAVLSGSGFLAVYLAGIVMHNRLSVFKRGIFLFHDAAAWLSQIVLFMVLGLLSFPSRLAAVTVNGLLVSAALIFVARPLTVLVSAMPFRFQPRELALIAWVGLKGAVPITLATFPLMAGVMGAEMIFDIVFFVVLVSALTQGWSLPLVARWLGLAEPAEPMTPVSVEIDALRNVDGEIVEYTVAPSARVAGQRLRDLALPDSVVVTLLVRDNTLIMPRGATALRPGDHVFVAMRSRLKPLMDRLFDPYAETPPLPLGLELDFHRERSLGQLHRFFGIPGPTWSEQPIGDLLDSTPPGETPRLGPFRVSRSADPDYVTLIYDPPEGEARESAESQLPFLARKRKSREASGDPGHERSPESHPDPESHNSEPEASDDLSEDSPSTQQLHSPESLRDRHDP